MSLRTSWNADYVSPDPR